MDELTETFSEFLAINFFNDLFKEAKDHELHGGAARDATLHHIKEFIGVEISGGRAVRTFDVIGEDFKSREGVGLRGGIEQKISVGLVGVGLLRALSDFDESGKDAAAVVEKGVFIEEVRDRVGRVMGLESALVKFLIFLGDGKGIHFNVGTGTFDSGLVLVACALGADVNGEVLDLSIAPSDGGIELKRGGLLVPVLDDFAENLGAGGGVEIGDRDIERGIISVLRKENIDDRGFGVGLGNDKGVWKDRGFWATGPEIIHKRLFNFDPCWNEEDGTSAGGSGVEPKELCRAEFGGFLKEVRLHELRMLFNGVVEGEVTNTLRVECLTEPLKTHCVVIDIYAASSVVADEIGARQKRVGGILIRCFNGGKAVDFEPSDRSESPKLIIGRGRGQRLKLGESCGATFCEPLRFVVRGNRILHSLLGKGVHLNDAVVRTGLSLTDGAFHLHVDKAFQFNGVFHRECLEEFVDESVDGETHGFALRESALHHVEDLLGTDL